SDQDFAVEDSVRPVAQDPLVEFMAGAVGLCMVNDGVMVHELASGGEIEAVQHAVSPFAVQNGSNVVADQTPADGDRMGGEAAISCLVGGDGRKVEGILAFSLKFVMIQDGALGGRDFGHRVG